MGPERKRGEEVSRTHRFDSGSCRSDVVVERIHRILGPCDGESGQDVGALDGVENE